MTLRILARPAFKNSQKLPYNFLLYSHLRAAGAEIVEYAFRRALFGRFDVLHLHWPESFLETRSLWRCLVSAAMAILAIETLRRKGTRIVWTGHDTMPHDLVFPRLERWFFAYVVSRVDGLIALTPAGHEALSRVYPRLQQLPFAIVPHGHFRGFFPDDVDPAAAREALGLPKDGKILLFFGQIRPYKGLETLIEAFDAAALPETTLVIAGRPNRRSNHSLDIAARTAAMSNVRTFLSFIPNEKIQLFMRAADLVICPFTRVLNSGSVMLALSFDRRVMAPAIGALPELQAAIGADWLRLYEAPLSPDLLRDALADRSPTGRPPLSAFDWPAIAAETLAAFKRFTRHSR